MKNFYISLNKSSADPRVAALAKIAVSDGLQVTDFLEKSAKADARGICFLEPRFVPTMQTFGSLPVNSYVFGYAKALPEELMRAKNLQYICLSDDECFVEENNRLTALAMREILLKRFGGVNQKILIMGYGKLTAQLERHLSEADIHILNFNHHKVPEITGKYGAKAFFERADLAKFPIIINTIPKQVIGEAALRDMYEARCTPHRNPKTKCKTQPAIYELASAPYGFDFGKLNPRDFDYNIEPALPGRFYPEEAARAVYTCIKRYIESARCPTIALCITGSSCSYLKLIPILKDLSEHYDIIPVLSPNADTVNRFVDIEAFKRDLREITGNPIITTIAGSETLSSNKRVLAAVVFPATGNTVAKLTSGITDTAVTMAVKALLRNARPCIIGISTNDALSGNAANIGTLLNRKNYFFVPFSQDDPVNKPFSMICNFGRVMETIDAALQGKQVQPIID